ncbi:MAG: AtpZ/AtpI family protein [Patescibacteria group bacterium]|nr:AtpZ/AtpI family protein [Patescibacteria group bacterium]
MKRCENSTSKYKQNDTSRWQSNIILFAKLNGWIAGPVIIALIIGKWLDDKYNIDPWSFLALIGFAFVISIIGITKEAMRTMGNAAKTAKKDHGRSSRREKNNFK